MGSVSRDKPVRELGAVSAEQGCLHLGHLSHVRITENMTLALVTCTKAVCSPQTIRSMFEGIFGDQVDDVAAAIGVVLHRCSHFPSQVAATAVAYYL